MTPMPGFARSNPMPPSIPAGIRRSDVPRDLVLPLLLICRSDIARFLGTSAPARAWSSSGNTQLPHTPAATMSESDGPAPTDPDTHATVTSVPGAAPWATGPDAPPVPTPELHARTIIELQRIADTL